ncbi:MAG: HNH endonuclease [Proteobacteria bacterium]|nr:HNH endonuclease [Pseudomonadota bacterium]
MTTPTKKPTFPRAPIKITPAFGFSYISERALREGLGRRQFGREEMEKVKEWFSEYEPQPACAFCGSSTVRRWDHLIPIRNNGETVLGNMVLACQPCDDSKGKRSFKEWMRGPPAKSPATRGVHDVDGRIRRLEEYLQAFGYVPTPLEKRLNANELDTLSDIRGGLDRLRTDVESFIEGYKTRVGKG